MKKILVFTTSLNFGGITSFVLNLVNYLSSIGHEVTLMYSSDETNMLNRVSKKVKHMKYDQLSKNEVIKIAIMKGYLFDLIKIKMRNRYKVSPIANMQRINYIRALYTARNDEKYDVAISSAEFFCNNFIVNNTNAEKKIGWIHPDYIALATDVAFDRKTLDMLDEIVTVSESSKESLLKRIPEYKEKVRVIENILDTKGIIMKSNIDINDFNYDCFKIVTVCRLDNSSKRLDRAVRACRFMIDNKIKIKWFLIGGGKDEAILRKLVHEYKIEDNFIFLGPKANPYPYMKNADLFVLTSQYEGKPIVVNEALILKCPVVVTNYQSAEEQVSKKFGEIITNQDGCISQELLNIVKNQTKISEWRDNLRDYEFYNNKTYQKLNDLIGDGS